jgi:hypothetical protein
MVHLYLVLLISLLMLYLKHLEINYLIFLLELTILYVFFMLGTGILYVSTKIVFTLKCTCYFIKIKSKETNY